jgi:hypothetical protein
MKIHVACETGLVLDGKIVILDACGPIDLAVFVLVCKRMKSKATQRVGRPRLSDADRRGKTVRVLITKGEHEELRQAAAVARVSLSSWVGRVALAQARKIRAAPKVE